MKRKVLGLLSLVLGGDVKFRRIEAGRYRPRLQNTGFSRRQGIYILSATMH